MAKRGLERVEGLGRRFFLLFCLMVCALLLTVAIVIRSTEEVDINSGRIRSTIWIGNIRIHSRVQDTWLSKAGLGATTPSWQLVTSQSVLRRVSPHYRYHSAVSQIDTLERLTELLPFDPGAEECVISRVYELWRGGGDESAGVFVEDLSTLVLSLKNRGGTRLTNADVAALPSEEKTPEKMLP